MNLRGLVWGWLLVAGACAAAAQTIGKAASGAAPQTVEAALHAMSDRAAVVFVGTVTAVRRVGTDEASAGAGEVDTEFAVEQGLRGTASGGTYTLREWAGRWAGTDERYRVGQRLLMMLHAPSASGLSSPVGGADGAIPIRGGGAAVGEGDGSTAAGTAVVDLRWVGARLRRPVVYRKEAPRSSIGRSVGMAEARSAVAAADGTQDAGAAQASVAVQEASVATVAGLLRSWKGAADAAR